MYDSEFPCVSLFLTPAYSAGLTTKFQSSKFCSLCFISSTGSSRLNGEVESTDGAKVRTSKTK